MLEMPLLETERLLIRPFVIEDLAEVCFCMFLAEICSRIFLAGTKTRQLLENVQARYKTARADEMSG